MADDQRKPWVLPVFFGVLIVLFWLVTDLMRPPKAAEATPPSPEETTAQVEGVTGTGQTP